jgi:hypothetical protein
VLRRPSLYRGCTLQPVIDVTICRSIVWLQVAETARSTVHHIAALEAATRARWQGRPPSTASDLGLLGDLEGIIDLDAQVSHSRLQLGVPE